MVNDSIKYLNIENRNWIKYGNKVILDRGGFIVTREQEINIKELNRRCRQSQTFIYQTSLYYMKKNTRLNVVTIVLSLIVSSALFIQVVQYLSSMQTSNSFYITLGTGALSILVTVLSVLQVLFNYSGLSEKCKTISARYGSIRREIEALMAQKNITDNELNERLNRINAAMTNLAEDSPHIPERIHKDRKSVV